MTDPDLDELASAHLDGATSPAEAARIAADPALQARVEALRRVRAAVAWVPPRDPDRRDTAIAAALAAFDTDDEQPASAPSVTSLTAVAARRGPAPRAVRVLGTAAAVILLALLVPLIGRLALSSDDDSAATFESTGAAIEGAPDQADELGEVERENTSTTAATDLQDLGYFADVDALVESFSAGEPQPARGSEAGAAESAADQACPAESALGSAGADIAETGRATVGAEVVIVVIVEAAGSDGRRLRLYRADDCTLVVELPL